MEWEDTDRIRDMRMVQSRAVFPERKDNREQNRPQKNPNAPLKCCALFQKHSCEHIRDHHPFTHACSYCARSVSMLCRHPEADCVRKQAEETKNSARRE